MVSLCVFCGSSRNPKDSFREAAVSVGQALAKENITLVYGGGHGGLMGVVADAALACGGEVVGVMPKNLVKREIAHRNLSCLHVVESMHERKALMAKLSNAFVALPGGIGTLEELIEMWTWLKIGLSDKPCGVLNTEGFFDHLLLFLNHMVKCNLLSVEHRATLRVSREAGPLINGLRTVAPKKNLTLVAGAERYEDGVGNKKASVHQSIS